MVLTTSHAGPASPGAARAVGDAELLVRQRPPPSPATLSFHRLGVYCPTRPQGGDPGFGRLHKGKHDDGVVEPEDLRCQAEHS